MSLSCCRVADARAVLGTAAAGSLVRRLCARVSCWVLCIPAFRIPDTHTLFRPGVLLARAPLVNVPRGTTCPACFLSCVHNPFPAPLSRGFLPRVTPVFRQGKGLRQIPVKTSTRARTLPVESVDVCSL